MATTGNEGVIGLQGGPWYSASFTKGTSNNLEHDNQTQTTKCPGYGSTVGSTDIVYMEIDKGQTALPANSHKVTMTGTGC